MQQHYDIVGVYPRWLALGMLSSREQKKALETTLVIGD